MSDNDQQTSEEAIDPQGGSRLMPSRRAVARTAIWTAPAVALGAAAPAFAVSPKPCPTNCITPVVAVSATVETNINDAADTGTLNIVGPPPPSPSGFTFLFTCSGLVSAGIAVVTGARLTMSGRKGALTTPTTYNATTLGAGVAAGALGATAVYITGLFSFAGVSMPKGQYVGIGPLDTSPIRPTELCIDLEIPFEFGIPGGGTQSQVCKMTVCYQPTFLSATVGYHDNPLLGEFPVTWATSWVLSSVS